MDILGLQRSQTDQNFKKISAITTLQTLIQQADKAILERVTQNHEAAKSLGVQNKKILLEIGASDNEQVKAELLRMKTKFIGTFLETH